MEFFVENKLNPERFVPGDIHEQEHRKSAYMQAGIPLGVCWEIRYWYGSKYYRIMPDVIGLDTTLAVETVKDKGFTNVTVNGSNLNTKISKQEPPGGMYAHKVTTVELTAEDTVIVPSIEGLKFIDAKNQLKDIGLFLETKGNGLFCSNDQQPREGERVPRGRTVHVTMINILQ
jgi:beta-lactam-binding protein with PASTA domain